MGPMRSKKGHMDICVRYRRIHFRTSTIIIFMIHPVT